MRTINNSFLFIMACLLLMGCPSEEETSSTDETPLQEKSNKKVTAKDIAAIRYTDYALSDTAEEVTRDWLKFHELSKEIELLKEGDLSFFKDDITLLNGFLNDMIAEIPERLDEPSIAVRMIALKTTIFKLEGSANLERESKEALLNSIKDVLIAHTNLVFQINKKLEKDAQNITKPQ
ncbi:MAG: hypothetical protein KJO49_06870 [Bacteroidia bacterium]|nr:hypothetical protein [Bacteroidia bacterium]NNL80922.1 hypothetical protein [Flavobacteriaceae bacterium]